MPAHVVDGMDVVAVVQAARAAVAQVRGGDGPVFLELRTYRFRAHSMFDPELYRDKREVEHWRERGPLHTFTDRLKAEGVFSEEDFQAIEATVAAEIAAAVEFATSSPLEPVEDLLRDVHTATVAP
jgi:pyruvate dehydrogenase E1 component alpha subunit